MVPVKWREINQKKGKKRVELPLIQCQPLSFILYHHSPPSPVSSNSSPLTRTTMSEEAKPTEETPTVEESKATEEEPKKEEEAAAPAEDEEKVKEEESTATFEPVVSSYILTTGVLYPVGTWFDVDNSVSRCR